MKSKYNTGVPIDINELPEEERKQAFHEWAEGSPALEQLLNEGYQRGFLSKACCAGDSGYPYISYDLDDENSRKMAMSIAKQLVDSDLDCGVLFYNDFSTFTEEEYEQVRTMIIEENPEYNVSPTRTITRLIVNAKISNAEEVFEFMSKAIKEAQLDSVKLPESEEEVPNKKIKGNRNDIEQTESAKKEGTSRPKIQKKRTVSAKEGVNPKTLAKTSIEEGITSSQMGDGRAAVEEPVIQIGDSQKGED